MIIEIDRESALPLYAQLKVSIKGSIENGTLKPDDKLPTEEELVNSHGLSRTTIRRAMSDLVNEGLLERMAAKGTFVKEPLSEDQAKKVIGIIAPFPEIFVEEATPDTWERNCDFLNGLFAEAALHSVQPEIIPYSLHCLDDKGDRAGSIFLCVYDGGGDILDGVKRSGMPYTIVANRSTLPKDAGNAVVYDGTSAISECVRFLADSGHKRIAYVGALGGSKFHAYQKALEACQIPFDAEITEECSAYGGFQEGTAAAAKRLLDRAPAMNAILCATDLKAIAVLRLLKERGVRVPEDISLMGCDDIREAAMQDPPLTTFSLPWREVGVQAMRSVIRQITTKTHKAGITLVKGKVVVRQSTRQR